MEENECQVCQRKFQAGEREEFMRIQVCLASIVAPTTTCYLTFTSHGDKLQGAKPTRQAG